MLLHAIPRTPGNPANHLERIRFTTGSLLLLQKIECRLILLFDRYFQVVVLQLCTALCTWRILPCRANLLLLNPIPPTPGNPVHNVQNTLSLLPVTPQDRDTWTVHCTPFTIVWVDFNVFFQLSTETVTCSAEDVTAVSWTKWVIQSLQIFPVAEISYFCSLCRGGERPCCHDIWQHPSVSTPAGFSLPMIFIHILSTVILKVSPPLAFLTDFPPFWSI